MRKLLLASVFLMAIFLIGWSNYQFIFGESSDLGRRPGEGRLTGYSLVSPNEVQALLIQRLRVTPVADQIELSFDLVSQYGMNEFPSFRVIVTSNNGLIRTVDINPRSYSHPEGLLSVAPVSFSIPRNGSETHIALKAVYP